MQSMQSVPLTTYVLTSILVQGEMYFDATLCMLIKNCRWQRGYLKALKGQAM
jgi:hypothetical protein